MNRLINLVLLFILFGIGATACSPETKPAAPITESFTNRATYPTYAVETIENCGIVAEPSANSLVLFDNNHNLLAGWSHILPGRRPFANAKQDYAAYQIASENVLADPSCNDKQTFPVILVKKYGDWDQQHANGIETKFLHENISFGEISEVVLDLKVINEKTSILNAEELKTIYGDYLSDNEISSLDGGNVNLEITLFEQGFDNQNIPSFTASLIVEIDQNKYADQWIRLTIPADNFEYFQEQNWEQTPVALADFSDNLILGLRINPETASGNVVRNFIPDDYDSTVPEHLKEMAISIKQVEIKLGE